MAISYQGAFDKMQEKGVTTYRIRKENILSQSTLQKMRDGKYVTTETIERLCLLLDCTHEKRERQSKEASQPFFIQILQTSHRKKCCNMR